MYFIIILLLLVILYNKYDVTEPFMNMHVAEFSDQLPLGGYEEGDTNREIMKEYRLLGPGGKKHLNINNLDKQKWETRFPYLIDQRYSYDDEANTMLGKLPLNMTNTVDNNIYASIKYPAHPYTRPIDNYDINDMLPAQYADRSKSSVEYLLGIDVQRERKYASINRILPWNQ